MSESLAKHESALDYGSKRTMNHKDYPVYCLSWITSSWKRWSEKTKSIVTVKMDFCKTYLQLLTVSRHSFLACFKNLLSFIFNSIFHDALGKLFLMNEHHQSTSSCIFNYVTINQVTKGVYSSRLQRGLPTNRYS